MPTFTLSGPGFDEKPFVADDWLSAMQTALDTVAATTDAALECEIGPDGDIVVVRGDVQFRVREAGRSLGPRLRDEDGPALYPRAIDLDAPEPAGLPVWKDREERGEAQLERLEAEVATLLESDGPLAERALELLLEYVPAESGAVLLPEADQLRFAVATGPRAARLAGTTLPRGVGIAGLVCDRAVAMLVREVDANPNHYEGVDRRTGYHTRAILCVPVRTGAGGVGCIELLNPFGGSDFASWHLAAAQVVAAALTARG